VAHEAGRHYRLDTPAGVLDIWVMRTHPDGTVDVVCSCYGARWERRHLRMGGGGPSVTVPAAWSSGAHRNCVARSRADHPHLRRVV